MEAPKEEEKVELAIDGPAEVPKVDIKEGNVVSLDKTKKNDL